MSTLTDIGTQFVRDGRMGIEQRGDQLLFYAKALAWTPLAIKRYRREIWNTLAEVAFGVGGLSVIAGSVGVIAFMAFFAGTEVGIQGYASLARSVSRSSPRSSRRTSTPARSRHWSHPSPWPRPWAAATPPVWARCASPRRSTP